MSNQNKIFVDGMIFKMPRHGAPDFVKGSISIKVADFKKFLDQYESKTGWVNIDLKIGKSGKSYAELNTWKPEDQKSESETNFQNGGYRSNGPPPGDGQSNHGDAGPVGPVDEINIDDIPY